MQAVPSTVRAEMARTNVRAYPEAIFEFDYSLMSVATVTAPDSRDEELFPKESVISQRYVNSGLPKAVVGQARASDKSDSIQYRVVDEEDSYKYWVSPSPSSSNGTISDAWMEVVYDEPRPANKVVAVFEVSYSSPSIVNIDVFNGSTWTRAASNQTPNSEGVIELSGNWTALMGVRVSVSSMSLADTFAHFIAISARYRFDASERITSWGVDKSLEDVSPLSPIGDSSTNSLSLSLENSDGLFDPENASSQFYRLMSRNVRVDASVHLPAATASGVSIPQGTFFVESWSYSAPSVDISIQCSDFSRFMQETFLPAFVLRNYTAKEAVREVLQRAGFNIDSYVVKSDPVIPYIWYSEEVSVWEALKDIANATLSYFYVNEAGDFMWLDFASMRDRVPTSTLDASENLIGLDHSFDVIANDINVAYNIYGSPRDPWTGDLVTQELWVSPEDDTLLSMPLARRLTTTSSEIEIATDLNGMRLWPESGYVNVQGERIKYGAKDNDRRVLQELERGVLGTRARGHSTNNLGTISSLGSTGRLSLVDGNLRITAPSSNTSHDYNYSLFGEPKAKHRVYGTSVRFPSSGRYEVAGLVINRAGTHGGIYVEISTTRQASLNNRNEIRVYRRATNNEGMAMHTPAIGIPYNVAIGNWYDIEIQVERTATIPVYSVYVNGMFVVSFEEEWRQDGQYGPFVRAATTAEFSRIYVSDGTGTSLGQKQFQNVLSGSSFSSDYVFYAEDTTMSVNEFSPQVRQIKEYNINYSKHPAMRASILNTNHWQARPFKFIPGPFGAHFYMENKSDKTAVIHGQSPNLFDEDTQMHLLIYGDPIVVLSEENRAVRDPLSIRRNGRVEMEVSNPWIQTDEMAERVAELIIQNFSDPMDTVSAEVFADYTYQLGDTVMVDYEEHGYNTVDHHYYVLSIGTTWRDGFSQQLTLRRKR